MSAYHPGSPTTPRQTGPNQWEIDSFRTDTAYVVTITPQGTRCTCPHYTTRLAALENAVCKHGQAVHQHIEQTKPTALQAAAAKTKALRDEELLRLAKQYQGQAAGCACLLELAARQAAADRDAHLKELFR